MLYGIGIVLFVIGLLMGQHSLYGMFVYFGVCGVTLAAAYLYIERDTRQWERWPTVDQYLESYPKCSKGDGIRCHKCGSNHIRHYSYSERGDDRRIHRCDQCMTYLYRSEI